MGSAGYLARASLRRRWAAIALLTLTIGVVGGIATGAVAAARRGSTSLDRLVTEYHVSDASVFTYGGADLEGPAQELKAALRTAGVTDFRMTAGATLVTFGRGGTFANGKGALADLNVVAGELRHAVVLEGRRAEAADEVALNGPALAAFRVEIGDRLEMSWYHLADLELLGGGQVVAPAGSRPMLITGRLRTPGELLTDARSEEGTIFSANQHFAELPATFYDDAGPDLASYGVGAYVDGTPDQLKRLGVAVEGHDGLGYVPGTGTELDGLESVGDAIDLESAAIDAFALVLALAAIGLLGSVVARTLNVEQGDLIALAAIGIDRSHRVRVAAILGAAVGTASAAIAAAVAIGVSTRTPLGYAAKAEVSFGLQVDTPVVVAGAVLTGVVVILAAVLGASLANRSLGASRPPRPSRWRLGSPLAATVGLRLIGETARGRGGSAVRAAGIMAVAGTVAVVGAWSFAGSMRHLVDTPALQGWNWDLAVGNYSQPQSGRDGAARLAADPGVDAYSGFNNDRVLLDGQSVAVGGFEGDVTPRVLTGRAPTRIGEVAVGTKTLASLGKRVGDTVTLSAGEDDPGTPTTIVGVITPPAALADGMTLDRGATITLAALQAVVGGGNGDDSALQTFVHLVRLRPGTGRAATIARLHHEFPGTVNTARPTADMRTMRRVQAIPYVLAGAIGVVGFSAVVVALAQLARRRRRELALLRCVGFTGRQVSAVLLWQATAFSIAAMIIGVPLGIVAGRSLWRLAADRIGTDVGPIVPLLSIGVAAAGLVAIANGLALIPALRARRSRAAVLLRSD